MGWDAAIFAPMCGYAWGVGFGRFLGILEFIFMSPLTDVSGKREENLQ